MSSGRSAGPTLGPAELDRLEDALEDLDLDRALAELDGDDPVGPRLSEYREVLVLCRDAMPLEDVPPGLLDGVLAEARAAASMAPAPAAAPSFWSRWRLGVWVPTLAFAGSAALLLFVLVPRRDEADASSSAVAPREAPKAEAKAARAADERLALAEPERAAAPAMLEGGDAQRGGGVAIGERAPEPSPPPMAPAVQRERDQEERDEQERDAPEAEVAAPKADTRRKVAGGGTGTGSVGYEQKPKPASKPEPSRDPLGGGPGGGAPASGAKDDDAPAEKKQDDGLWSELARADSDRRSGSCGLAKMRYDKLRKLDDAAIRARALAGAGLCAAASDDASTAKKLFAQARAADPSVGAFIDRELAQLEDAPTDAKD